MGKGIKHRNDVLGFLIPPPTKKDSKEGGEKEKEKETKGEAIKEEDSYFTLFSLYLSKPSLVICSNKPEIPFFFFVRYGNPQVSPFIPLSFP